MLSHGALVSQYTSCIVAGSYRPDDVVLHALPLYHCGQLHCFLMPYLWLGAKNILLRRADPGAMLAAAERYGVTSIFAPPTVWIGILRHADFEPARLKTLAKGYYGASIMPVEIVHELLDRLPGHGSGTTTARPSSLPSRPASSRRTSCAVPVPPAAPC